MMDGEFQTMRAFIRKYSTLKMAEHHFTHLLCIFSYHIIDALNETNPGMHISEDAIIHIELAFRKMREVFMCKFVENMKLTHE
jgi:hypothetical protein